MARLGEILSHLGRIKKSQFVVVALPAAAQGATVAAATVAAATAQCTVESSLKYQSGLFHLNSGHFVYFLIRVLARHLRILACTNGQYISKKIVEPYLLPKNE